MLAETVSDNGVNVIPVIEFMLKKLTILILGVSKTDKNYIIPFTEDF